MDKVMLITGASKGIGAATARIAVQRGWTVCVNYRSDEFAARRIVEEISANGGRAFIAQGDVSREEDVLRVFETVDREYGRLDGLVNNAGILEQQTRLDQMSADRFARVFATNITGAFLCAREAVRRMSTAHGGQGGTIVNVSSAASRIGSPWEYIDYAASKGALDTLTLGLSKEVAAEGVRVNAVRPGLIYTDIHAAGGEPGRVDRLGATVPIGRGGTAEEVALSIMWLMSEDASYCTGSLLDVAGGR
ncbi:SDR family oxidoreductase [Dichotomicrobium thermohalophilum]|uniref:NAD(P)-dependent dehydrogenase (Short-subunit alcohol dehydrogenase family) n=1 Tax=Dichotomicrobium thermohalophilum TaxID=933063 RepID=A0A397PFJ1_9HYPH|nr:SDR family oxidoreductase [Dichotomicrobium thermohalophilum]RIA47728.1 NAD(P)-dependent dehydrogenase (short-subunit alcohol dehydrogenase family) [Dichotomicrobium thermohalophilum]